ncbi:MAG: hypothetical protein AB2L20_12470 [Mangrovibacterium sp.]
MKTKIAFLLFLLGFEVPLIAQTPQKGYIIEIDIPVVLVDYTSADVKIGDHLRVLSDPKVMVHPISGQKIEKEGELIATLKITETYDSYSVAGVVLPSNAINKLKVGDKVLLTEKAVTKTSFKNGLKNLGLAKVWGTGVKTSPENSADTNERTKVENAKIRGAGEGKNAPIISRDIFIGQQIGYNYLLNAGDLNCLSLSYKFKIGCLLSKNLAITPGIGVTYTRITEPPQTIQIKVPYEYYINGKKYTKWKWESYTTEKDPDSSTTFFFGSGMRYMTGNFFLEPAFYFQKPEGSDVISSLDSQIGYTGFVSKKIAVELSVGYLRGIGKNSGGDGSLSGNIGLSYYL